MTKVKSIKLLTGYHLTATNRKAISHIITNREKFENGGILSACSKIINYKIEEIENAIFSVVITQNKKDDWTNKMYVDRNSYQIKVLY